MNSHGYLNLVIALGLAFGLHTASAVERSHEHPASESVGAGEKHGDHEHAESDETAPALQKTAGNYTFALSVSPTKPLAGKLTEIEVRITTKASGGDALLGDEAPYLEEVTGRIEPSDSDEWLPGHSEGEAGHYGWHVTLPKSGEYTLRIRLEDGTEATFPLVVADAPRDMMGGMSGMMEMHEHMHEMMHGEQGMMESAGKSFQEGGPVYNLSFWWDATPTAGRKTDFFLRLNDVKTGRILTPEEVEIVHEERIHVLLARNDLQHFDHVHPKPVEGAMWMLSYTFPTGGTYKFWFDFKPKDADSQILAFTVPVSGQAEAEAFDAATSLDKTFGDVYVALSAEPETIRAGEPIHFVYDVSRNGKPAKLEPYLGAGLHAVVISEDTLEFGHTHGMEPSNEEDAPVEHEHDHASHDESAMKPNASGKLAMTYVFPKPGIYKLFGQFRESGHVVTTDFTVHVAEGEPKEGMMHDMMKVYKTEGASAHDHAHAVPSEPKKEDKAHDHEHKEESK